MDTDLIFATRFLMTTINTGDDDNFLQDGDNCGYAGLAWARKHRTLGFSDFLLRWGPSMAGLCNLSLASLYLSAPRRYLEKVAIHSVSRVVLSGFLDTVRNRYKGSSVVFQDMLWTAVPRSNPSDSRQELVTRGDACCKCAPLSVWHPSWAYLALSPLVQAVSSFDVANMCLERI
ncbi:hypothetical protein ARMSODRAFT_1009623 [Armillaria solidipes]|uniref:Uncharacterized protein n=1 Tax=Armillaria solidipes TaxID=1076256 RepID=A0A2H3B4W1_9AGAR|nr:hypothetical protein ARMSODRAFT_1009623 [Armillaria solidipes]